MISANGGLPAHRYTPQVTPRWPRGSEPASSLYVLNGQHGTETCRKIRELRLAEGKELEDWQEFCYVDILKQETP